MKIKTNVRAGKNGADDTTDTSSSTSTSSSNQRQRGKDTPVVVTPPVSRCVGL